MLSPEKLKKLQLEQKKLDEFIWKNYRKRNNITTDNTVKTKESFIRGKIALFVEIGELANELKTFKHWKSRKDINWVKVKEELIDCLHFYLSWTNSFEIDFSDYKFQKLNFGTTNNNSEQNLANDYNELLLSLFSETELFNLEFLLNDSLLEIIEIKKTKENFYRWLTIFEELYQKMGMDEKEIEEEYMKKNKINWERQQTNY